MTEQLLKGADISFVDEIESEGGTYYEDGVRKDVLDILKASGMNSARLRIWNEPEFDYCNTDKTLKMAKRIKEKGLHFLLDFHYSDYWADPSKQHVPKAWKGLSIDKLTQAVEDYTADVIERLGRQGTWPDMVQIGNEITNGMIWPEGRVNGEGDQSEQWGKLAELIKAGVRGVKRAIAAAQHGESRHIPTMIHIDRGGDNEGSRLFYDKLQATNVEFDIIGLSYYSWWHGTLEEFQDNLHDLAARYEKDIVVAEVAYPWTMTPPDDKPLIFGSEDWVYPGYPPTVEGQANWLRNLMKVIRETPGGRGIGVYYWEPCWIPSKPEWSVGHENNWSNLTLFDYRGNKLPSLDVFKDSID